MIVENESLLREFRGPGKCEWCGKQCRTREAAHIFAKGMGGGGRLDVRINLVGLGLGGWVGVRAECNCHSSHHTGHEPSKRQLMERAAEREGVDATDIEAVLWLLRRLPKEASRERIEMEVGRLTESEQALAWRTLRESGKWA